MIVIGLIVIYVLGWSLLNRISGKLSVLEKTGLAFLVGIGIESFIMFLLDILGIRFNITNLLIISIILISVLNLKYLRESREVFSKIRDYKFQKPSFSGLNLVWLIFALLVVVLVYGSVSKSLFWPTSAYDNVAGYDLMGKVMAAEGAIQNSLFEVDNVPISGLGNRAKYPPLVASSFAFAYMCGLETSKIMTSMFFISFVILFYGLLKKFTTDTAAIFFTFFVIISPEYFAFTSLSTTNIPTAFYAAGALIYLYLYLKEERADYLIIAALLMGLTSWARSDSLVFNMAGFFVLIYHFRKNLLRKELLLYVLLTFLPFLSWMVYSNIYIRLDQDVFVNNIFWDSDKFAFIMSWVKILIFSTGLYGISFYIFFIVIGLNIRHIKQDESTKLLFIIFLTWVFYTILFYQMDPVKMGSSLKHIMEASYKRGMFPFIPLVWYYVASTIFVRKIFDKFQIFISGN